jgi:hypothetical protein
MCAFGLQFGFKVTLPHALPPSCQISRGGDSGRIVYRVKANIGKSMAFDIKAEAAFTVLPAPPMNVIPVNNAATQEMMQCCCFSKGQAYAQVSVAKDVAMAGENLQVTVQVYISSLSILFLACFCCIALLWGNRHHFTWLLLCFLFGLHSLP